MNDRQRCWLYDQLKTLVQEVQGKELDAEITGRINEKINYLLAVSEKDRTGNETLDNEIRQLTRLILLTVHACEHLGRTL